MCLVIMHVHVHLYYCMSVSVLVHQLYHAILALHLHAGQNSNRAFRNIILNDPLSENPPF